MSPAELLRRALTYSSGLPGHRAWCCQVGSWSSGPVAKSSFVCRVFPFLIVTCKFCFLKCSRIAKGRRNYRSRGHLAGSLGRACDSGCQAGHEFEPHVERGAYLQNNATKHRVTGRSLSCSLRKGPVFPLSSVKLSRDDSHVFTPSTANSNIKYTSFNSKPSLRAHGGLGDGSACM